ncbi:hypothetical protein G9E11_12215 [Arthrobacter sp. IA7]|uniref:hypothetical protein n=1 Tax=Arthrobacter ipis TaxID=2716202 RepID=UPI001681E7CC|nr:hypothetical protein [Arthrobacter ipis]MBD1542996.1 hypothetical protein [Arthrobacter ipis]
MTKSKKPIRQLEAGDRFKLGSSQVEVISCKPKNMRISYLELKFLKSGHHEIRTFVSHHVIEIKQETK